MASIGGVLNSVSSSLLSEINNFNSSQTQSNTSSSTISMAATPDQATVSPIAQLMKELRTLQQSNPVEFKQVLTDAATKLQAAASQTTDSSQAAFLNNLASKFQAAATSGNLSALTQNGASGSTASGSSQYAAHGHRHHHGGGGSSLVSSILNGDSSQSTSSTTSQIQSLLAGISS